jgi:peptidoglycan/LPS O-acetylase OafA/YrhL
MKRIDELTGLRAVAVGMVVLAHSASGLPHSLSYILSKTASGDVGVQIFFVLSGYLITRILMGEYAKTASISFWGFYRRRLYRITPAFYAFLLVLSVLAMLGVVKASWQEIVLSGIYIWNYAHMFGLDGTFASHPEGYWYVGHTWSLALEEQFYWIWPAAFLFISRKKLPYLLPAVILFVPILRITLYFIEPSVRPQLHMMFHTGIDTILVGCFLAMNEEALLQRFKGPLVSPTCLSAALVLELVVLNVTQARLGGFYIATYGATLGAAVVAFLMLAIMQQPSHWFCRLLRTPVFIYGGLISYSLYLWQQVFTNYKMPTGLAFPLDLVVPIGAAALSYHFIEKPFLRLKDRTRKQRPSGAAAVVVAQEIAE